MHVCICANRANLAGQKSRFCDAARASSERRPEYTRIRALLLDCEEPMTKHETDRSILTHIEDLVAQEQKLYQDGNLNDHDQVRLKDISVELDQCWDLLRQRRALREFGEDPDKAKVRPAKVVENYEQ